MCLNKNQVDRENVRIDIDSFIISLKMWSMYKNKETMMELLMPQKSPLLRQLGKGMSPEAMLSTHI